MILIATINRWQDPIDENIPHFGYRNEMSIDPQTLYLLPILTHCQKVQCSLQEKKIVLSRAGAYMHNANLSGDMCPLLQ